MTPARIVLWPRNAFARAATVSAWTTITGILPTLGCDAAAIAVCWPSITCRPSAVSTTKGGLNRRQSKSCTIARIIRIERPDSER